MVGMKTMVYISKPSQRKTTSHSEKVAPAGFLMRPVDNNSGPGDLAAGDMVGL